MKAAHGALSNQTRLVLAFTPLWAETAIRMRSAALSAPVFP